MKESKDEVEVDGGIDDDGSDGCDSIDDCDDCEQWSDAAFHCSTSVCKLNSINSNAIMRYTVSSPVSGCSTRSSLESRYLTMPGAPDLDFRVETSLSHSSSATCELGSVSVAILTAISDPSMKSPRCVRE